MADWASRSHLESTLAGLVTYLEADFRRWPEFDLTPRVASHSRDGVIELMPTSDGNHYSFKYVNGHPANPGRGYQTVTAFGVLADVHTGYPLLLSELTVTTALRTGAMSALAAKYLARPDCRPYCSAQPSGLLLDNQWAGCNYKLPAAVWRHYDWSISHCVLRGDNAPIQL